MSDSPDQRAVMVTVGFNLTPPLIRKSLLEKKEFREKYGFVTDGTVSFGDNIVSFQRSVIFNAIRNIFVKESTTEVIDNKGQRWQLAIDKCDQELPQLLLSRDQQQLFISDLLGLSNDAAIRIRFFEESASDANLPSSAQKEWLSILTERALEDEEVAVLQEDICDTPIHIMRLIRSEITGSTGNISSLVPNSRKYFERLVGVYDGSNSILDFAKGTGHKFFEQLSEWQPYKGFLFSLLLSAHSSLTAEINIDRIAKKDLEKAFDYLDTHGDIISQLGAFEVGLRILPDMPELEPTLLRLVKKIRDDDLENKSSKFRLLAALFILIDGELARTRLFTETPPFYRRLASLAQAALIQRQFIKYRVDCDHFFDWAFSSKGAYFYMQSFVDMRAEPRWNPDLIDPSQLQAEFLGRMMFIGNRFQTHIVSQELCDIILGEGEQSLIKRCGHLRPYFAGPLDGFEDSPSILPDNLAKMIQEQLGDKELTANSFNALVNSAMIFKVTSDQVDLAAKALKLCNHNISNLEDKSHLASTLNGLSNVAAVSRSRILADEVRILVRRYRHDPQYRISSEEAMQICLVASAAHRDLIEWREFVGEWLTELAFDDLDRDEGKILHSHLSVLLGLIPELWVSCARADAALEAWCHC